MKSEGRKKNFLVLDIENFLVFPFFPEKFSFFLSARKSKAERKFGYCATFVIVEVEHLLEAFLSRFLSREAFHSRKSACVGEKSFAGLTVKVFPFDSSPLRNHRNVYFPVAQFGIHVSFRTIIPHV
jgi:hypothetical protein